jgi:hypothetical protein
MILDPKIHKNYGNAIQKRMGWLNGWLYTSIGHFKQLAYLPYINYLCGALGSFIVYHKGLKGNTV